MAKSSKQAAGNRQGGSNKSAGESAKTGNPAGNTDPASSTAATGNAQRVKSQPDTAMAEAMAGLPQLPATDPAGQSAIAALKQDHRRVEGLFSEFEQATEEQRKQELVAMICSELNIHTRLEEEIFYPACREAIGDEDLMDEAQVEHDAAKLLIADLTVASGDDPYLDAKVKLLSEMIKHHVAEEEKRGEGVFAKAEQHQVDNASLAAELAERKQALQRRTARLKPTRAVSFNLDLSNLMEEDPMARYSDMDRDDRGRFAGGRGGSRSRHDDDDRGGRDRDDRGRFMSDRVGSRSRYDDDDDDDRRGRGRGRGGWFGDSEGHSRAARERWEDDDDRGGRGRSRSRDDDDDDRGGRGHGRGGWFGDSEGHSRAGRSRRDDDDDDRRGRSSRGGSRSRSRDDDDDGRGWFGDSRGHAEAARRGWENRR